MLLNTEKLRRKTVYSGSYYDDQYEYRHVVIPWKLCFECDDLMTEEWRELGLEMSTGWIHYAIHQPEPNIVLFRRPRRYVKFSEEERLNYLSKSDEIRRGCKRTRELHRYWRNEKTDITDLAINDKSRRIIRYHEAKRRKIAAAAAADADANANANTNANANADANANANTNANANAGATVARTPEKNDSTSVATNSAQEP